MIAKLFPMKQIFTLLLMCVSFVGLAQNKKTVRVQTTDLHYKHRINFYIYPNFTEGQIILHDSDEVEIVPINLSRFYNQIHFLSNGDTLAIKNINSIKYVVIYADTFEVVKGKFYKKLSHSETFPNLYAYHDAQRIGIEKKGPYGVYTPVSSANSNTTVTLEDNITTYIIPDERHVFELYDELFIYDKESKQMVKLKKGNFFDFFPKQANQLRKFADKENLSTQRERDLLKMYEFLATL